MPLLVCFSKPTVQQELYSLVKEAKERNNIMHSLGLTESLTVAVRVTFIIRSKSMRRKRKERRQFLPEDEPCAVGASGPKGPDGVSLPHFS